MSTREDNRRDFPFVPEWKANLEAAFGEVFVRYANNGKREIGEPSADRCEREGLTECRYRPEGVWK